METRRERETKRMEEDGEENDQTSRRGNGDETEKKQRLVWMKRRTKG